MPLFRRAAADPEPAPVDDRPATQQGKGRPTPTRKEAEAARKQNLKVPSDPKQARKAARQRAAADRARTREAMATGDERYLPARDAGPVKSYVRDFVDSRRTAGEFFVPIAVVILVLGMFVPGLANILVYAWLIMLVVIAVDSVLIVRRLKRGLAEKFPGESTKGTTAYALMRTAQLRRMRLPKPKVKVGGAPVTPRA